MIINTALKRKPENNRSPMISNGNQMATSTWKLHCRHVSRSEHVEFRGQGEPVETSRQVQLETIIPFSGNTDEAHTHPHAHIHTLPETFKTNWNGWGNEGERRENREETEREPRPESQGEREKEREREPFGTILAVWPLWVNWASGWHYPPLLSSCSYRKGSLSLSLSLSLFLFFLSVCLSVCLCLSLSAGRTL